MGCVHLIELQPHLVNDTHLIWSSIEWVNSLWPCDVIWWHESVSTLAQVMAWCLTAPSHYLKQCWLVICAVWQNSHESNFTGVPKLLFYISSLRMTFLKLLPHLPGLNEWIKTQCYGIIQGSLLALHNYNEYLKLDHILTHCPPGEIWIKF